MARLSRQNLATLVLLGLYAVACGQGSNSGSGSGFTVDSGANAVQTPAQAKDPTYEPNPEFEEFVRQSRQNKIPREKPTGQKPAEMRIEEPAFVGDSSEAQEPLESEPIPEDGTEKTTETPARTGLEMPPKQTPNANVKPTPVRASTPAPSGNSVPKSGNSVPKDLTTTPAKPPQQPPVTTRPAAPAPSAPGNHVPKPETGNSVSRPNEPPNLYRRGEKCKNLIYLPTTQAWCQHHNGRLYNGFQLEPDKGVYLSDQFKGKQWTTIEVDETIRHVGREFFNTFHKNTFIGSASQHGGGPIINSSGRQAHVSHENGLDLDVFLPRKNDEKPVSYTASTRTGQTFTKLDEGNFDHRATIWLLKEYNRSGRVYHFFVSHEVKAFLCKEYPNDIIHTKISRYEGHYSHFHVKFRCGENAGASCVDPENPITVGTDCPRNSRM